MNANNVFDLIDPAHASDFNRRTLTAAALVSGVSQDRIYAFPESIRSSEGQTPAAHVPFVLFAPYKRKRGTFYSLDSTQVFDSLPSPSWLIALPLPASALRTGYGVQYDQYDIGFGFGTTIASAKKLIQGPSTEEKVRLKQLAESLIQTNFGSELTKTVVNSDIFQSAGYNVITAIAGAINIPEPVIETVAGVSENPFTEQIFKNVEFRTHVFEYTFIPRNERESKLIDQIIQVFKFYMLPAQGSLTGSPDSSLFFSFPYEFQITYSVQDTTFTLLPSVLERFDVDYSGADQPKFFVSSGEGKQYPTKITMTLQFREVVLLNRDHIAAPAPVIKEAVDSRNVTRYRF